MQPRWRSNAARPLPHRLRRRMTRPATSEADSGCGRYIPSAVDSQGAEPLIGCAGWAIPSVARHQFPDEGSTLQRYTARFSAVEINSSFYRPHKSSTYARWADSVPPTFRFAVKVPKEITHTRRLVDIEAMLEEFLAQASCLGNRLGCLLMQLPPTLGYSAAAEAFFSGNATALCRVSGARATQPRMVHTCGGRCACCSQNFSSCRRSCNPCVSC